MGKVGQWVERLVQVRSFFAELHGPDGAVPPNRRCVVCVHARACQGNDGAAMPGCERLRRSGVRAGKPLRQALDD